MPSRDSSGKRLSGGAQKKLVADRVWPIHPALGSVPAPPDTVAAVEAWAAALNLRCAAGLEVAKQLEAERLNGVVHILRTMARLKDKAARSEKALLLRRLRLKEEQVENNPLGPIDDPAASVLHAFQRLSLLAYEAASDPKWRPKVKNSAIAALGTAGFLPCNADLKAIAERVKAAE